MAAMRFRLLSLFTCLAVIAAACGGGDDGASEADQELVDALTAYFVDPANDTIAYVQAEAECSAEKIVSDIGADRLGEVGVTAEFVPELEETGFSAEEFRTVVAVFRECVDLRARFIEVVSEGFGQEAAECFADALGEDVIAQSLEDELTGAEDSTDEAFETAASFCGLG